MKTKIVFFIASLVLLAGAPAFAQAQIDDASKYLFEYGRQLFREGNTSDAIHELKKSLLVNPNNCAALDLLKQISPDSILKIEISAEKSKVCPGQEMTFVVQAPGYYGSNEFTYIWHFGDGSVFRGGPQASHSFERAGDYLVKVTLARKFASQCCDTASIPVHIYSPPQAKISSNPSCCINKQYHFDGSASSDPDGGRLTYHWDFGDGASAEGQNPAHIYSRAGKYNVALTVFDDSGPPCNSGQDSAEIIIEDKPVALMDITSQN